MKSFQLGRFRWLLISAATVIAFSFNTALATETGGLLTEVQSSGKGGIEVRDTCPPGSALVGVSASVAQWRDVDVLTELSALCKEIADDGQKLTDEESNTELRGTEKGASRFSLLCPKDLVLTGSIIAVTDDRNFVSGLQLECGSLPFGKQTIVTAFGGAKQSAAEKLNCPESKIGVGIILRFGAVVDAFGIQCAGVKNVAQSPISGAKLSVSSKIYPFLEEVSVLSVEGGSSSGKPFISDVRDKTPDIGCAFEDGFLSASAPGECVIEVTKDGDSLYAPTTTETTFTFSKAVQSITVTITQSDSALTDSPFSAEVQAFGAGGEGVVTFVASDGTANGCSVVTRETGSILTAESAGTCLVTASIEGDLFYEAAKSAETTFEFVAAEDIPIEVENESISDFPAYDPLSEPEVVVGLQVAAFALLSAIALGATSRTTSESANDSARRRSEDDDPEKSDDGNSDSNSNGENSDEKEERESGDVASADVTKVTFQKRSLSWGDNSRLWKISHQPSLEEKFKKVIEGISVISPLGSRILLDGSYLRAMFSGLSILPALFGVFVGIAMMQDAQWRPFPTSVALLILAIFVSTLDATAGLASALVVAVISFATSNVNSLDAFMSLLGFCAILVMPGLIASGVRPMRRYVSDDETLWERATDYLLATILGGWAIGKLVGSLNGLAGVVLPVTASAELIGIWASAFIALRMIVEDTATYLFPDRLAQQEASPRPAASTQPWVALMIKTTIFFLVAYQFLGLNLQLIVGTVVFVVPQVFALLIKKTDHIKSIFVGFLIPKGAPKIVIMVFVGGLFSQWIQNLFADPSTFISWSFVLLAIPGFVLGMMKIFALSPSGNWKYTPYGSILYKVGGIFVAALIIAMYQGVDLYSLVLGS